MRRWGNRQGAPQRGPELDLGGRGEKGSPEWSPPHHHSDAVRAEEGGDGSGIQWSMAVARVSERDGASVTTSWWCRLDWRRASTKMVTAAHRRSRRRRSSAWPARKRHGVGGARALRWVGQRGDARRRRRGAALSERWWVGDGEARRSRGGGARAAVLRSDSERGSFEQRPLGPGRVDGGQRCRG
jgi:hypothetical protein